MPPFRTAAAALCFGLVACAADDDLAPVMSVQEIGSPAGPSSGEPFLSVAAGTVRLSWLEQAGEAHELRFSSLGEGGWSVPRTVARSDRFFVNWADFPSLVASADGTLWAHWLERGGAGTYDYGIRVVRSDDGGEHWSEPWMPHEDGTPTEHGFVSLVPTESGVSLSWLDGRQSAPGPDGSPPIGGMTVRYRTWSREGDTGPETLVDARTCDCCQTAMALTAQGPIVVYRDRSEGEVRDIAVSRLVGDTWTEGVPVHEDGWVIAGCPVNGPAVAAEGERVVVAWFTGAGDIPRVKVAFSDDAGATFADPVGVDDGSPVGRVDVLLLDDRTALVSWIERSSTGSAEVRVRRVTREGQAGASAAVAGSSEERASGFPRMVRAPDGSILLARTDIVGAGTQVKVSRVEVSGS